MKKDIPLLMLITKPGVAILILAKIVLIVKNITKDKEDYFIIIKWPIHQEIIKIFEKTTLRMGENICN